MVNLRKPTSRRWPAAAFGTLWLAAAGCHAPRDNPLDPASPYHHPPEPPAAVTDLAADTLMGWRCRLTWTAPEGARRYLLYWGPADWNGRDMDRAQRYTGDLPGVKLPGSPESVWIDLVPGLTQVWVLFSTSEQGLWSAGSNPVSTTSPRRDRPGRAQVSAWSEVYGRWTGDHRRELHLRAAIADSDTVQLAWVQWEGRTLTLLELDTARSIWTGRVTEGLIPSGSLERLVGHSLKLLFLDRAGFINSEFGATLVRIVDPPPLGLTPRPGDTTDANPPVLEWEPYNGLFLFTYRVEIWQVIAADPTVPQLIYRRENIPADSTRHSVPLNLPTDALVFFWTVAVVDEFGDFAVSVENNFWLRQ